MKKPYCIISLKNRFWKFFPSPFFLYLLGFLIRFFWILNATKSSSCFITQDSIRFIEEAQDIIKNLNFPAYYDLPLYPTILAFFYLLGADEKAIVFALGLIGYTITFIVFKKAAGWSGCIASILLPSNIFFSGFLLTESISGPLFLLLFYLTFWGKNKKLFEVFTGILSGVIVMLKFFLLFPVFIVLIGKMLKEKKNPYLNALILIGILTTWGFYNYHRFGYFFISFIGHFNLYYYNASGVIASHFNQNIDYTMKMRLNRADSIYKQIPNVLTYHRILLKDAVDNFFNYPLDLIYNILVRGVPVIFKPIYGYLQISLFCNYMSFPINLHPLLIFPLTFQMIYYGIMWLLLCFTIIKRRLSAGEVCVILLLWIYVIITTGGPYINDVRFRVSLEYSWILLAISKLKK